MSAPPGFRETRLIDPFEIHVGPVYEQGEKGARRFGLRVAKQHVTHEGDHRFTIVLEENVLRHQIGGPAVLREQLEYLRSAISLPSVKLGIIPFTADRSALHPVEMFFMHDDAQVNIELVSGWLRVTQPSEVGMYAAAFARLAETAVYGSAARTLINRAIGALG